MGVCETVGGLSSNSCSKSDHRGNESRFLLSELNALITGLSAVSQLTCSIFPRNEHIKLLSLLCIHIIEGQHFTACNAGHSINSHFSGGFSHTVSGFIISYEAFWSVIFQKSTACHGLNLPVKKEFKLHPFSWFCSTSLVQFVALYFKDSCDGKQSNLSLRKCRRQ